MKIEITLPNGFKETEISTLLEKQWLVPKKVRHFLRTGQNVAVNAQTVKFHETATGGDKITLTFDDGNYPTPSIEHGDAELITPLFEDEHLLIVNKPVGMKTHPNDPGEEGTLLNHVAAYLAQTDTIPYVVHRLDRDTSGAILFAKNPFILPILSRMLEAKAIKRTYQAVASRAITQKEMTINKRITKDRHDSRKRMVSDVAGQEAITHVTCDHIGENCSYVYCVLETGRTHQIRVHLASIGHPIMGDPLYHPQPDRAARLMLHAYELSLVHPLTQESITVQALPSLWA